MNKKELVRLIFFNELDILKSKIKENFDIDQLFLVSYSKTKLIIDQDGVERGKHYFQFEEVDNEQQFNLVENINRLKYKEFKWPSFFYAIFFKCSNDMLKLLLSHTKYINFMDLNGVDIKELLKKVHGLDHSFIVHSFLHPSIPTPHFKFKESYNLEIPGLRNIKKLKNGNYFVSGVQEGIFLDQNFKIMEMTLTSFHVKKLKEVEDKWIIYSDKLKKYDVKKHEISNINVQNLIYGLEDIEIFDDNLFLMYLDGYFVHDLKKEVKIQNIQTTSKPIPLFYDDQLLIISGQKIFFLDIWKGKDFKKYFLVDIHINEIKSAILLRNKYIVLLSSDKLILLSIEIQNIKSPAVFKAFYDLDTKDYKAISQIDDESFIIYSHEELSLWKLIFNDDKVGLKRMKGIYIPTILFYSIESVYIEKHKIYVIDEESNLYIYEMGYQIDSFEEILNHDAFFKFK